MLVGLTMESHCPERSHSFRTLSSAFYLAQSPKVLVVENGLLGELAVGLTFVIGKSISQLG